MIAILSLLGCSESDNDDIQPQPPAPTSCVNVVTDAYGRKYPSLEPPASQYCGPGWGRKMCRFLRAHDGTEWVDDGSGGHFLPDVTFSNFSGTPYFITFSSQQPDGPAFDGLKLGESTAADGTEYTVAIRQDDEGVFSFVYRNYGRTGDLKYTVVHKYELVDELLHFSSSDGRQGIFRPST